MKYDLKIEGLDELKKKVGIFEAQEVIEKPLYQGALLIQAWAQKNRLSGPRPQYLGVKTGRLRSSITTSRSIKRGEFAFFIGTNVEYAAMHEFGFKGDVTVSAHPRRTFGNVRLFGRTKKLTTNRGYVNSFTRKMNIPARPFLRPSIENKENQNNIITLLTRAISEALSK